MKRVIAIGLLVNAALLAGLLLKEKVTVHAAGGAGAPAGNGDVNGDGLFDVSDVVYLANAFFLGGPAPVAIECPPPAVTGLPATGQTECFDRNGAPIDCASPDFPRQDGFYKVGCPKEGRFVNNGDGTITDTCTGLMWQKDVVGGMNWQAALKYCAGLKLAGHVDWRLPNVMELQSIVDNGAFLGIDPIFEQSFYVMTHWSSTTVTDRKSSAYPVGFHESPSGSNDKNTSYNARGVRNAP